jgi:hypothetical protein
MKTSPKINQLDVTVCCWKDVGQILLSNAFEPAARARNFPVPKYISCRLQVIALRVMEFWTITLFRLPSLKLSTGPLFDFKAQK